MMNNETKAVIKIHSITHKGTVLLAGSSRGRLDMIERKDAVAGVQYTLGGKGDKEAVKPSAWSGVYDSVPSQLLYTILGIAFGDRGIKGHSAL